MKILDEMCEVQLQEEVMRLKKVVFRLRNSLADIQKWIDNGDHVYASCAISTILEATKGEQNETRV